MTDKEKLELLNLRKKVEAQRVEIKRMSEQLERHKEYTKNLESLFEGAIDHMDLDGYNRYSYAYKVLKMTS